MFCLLGLESKFCSLKLWGAVRSVSLCVHSVFRKQLNIIIFYTSAYCVSFYCLFQTTPTLKPTNVSWTCPLLPSHISPPRSSVTNSWNLFLNHQHTFRKNNFLQHTHQQERVKYKHMWPHGQTDLFHKGINTKLYKTK